MPEEKALAKAPKQSLREYMRSPEITTRFAEVVGKSNANSYISSVLIAVSSNEDLQKCEMKSIVSSALRSATLQLSVDPATGYAYLVPYGNQATLIVGYKGLYQMAIRTGKYRAINVFEVWEGETAVEDRFTGFWSIEGTPKNKEKPIGIMGYFEMLPNWKQGQKEGYKKYLYMTMAEIEAHAKKFSKSYDSTRSGNIWKTNRRSMEKKTVLRLLLIRWADLSGVSLEDVDVDGDFQNLPEPGEAAKEEPFNEEKTLKEMGFEPDKKDVIEGEFEPETTTEKKTAPPEEGKRPPRPYEPEYLKKALVEMAQKYQTEKTPVGATDRTTLLSQMRMLFTGFANDRELATNVLKFLTGVDSVTALEDHEVLAIKSWLATKKNNDGELLPCPNATDEAEKIIAFLNK
jgi:recombination protein RecT